jgi:acetylornithine deacetylase
VVLDAKEELVRVLGGEHREVIGRPLAVSTVIADIRYFNYYGIPAICNGPAGENIHGLDESVDLESPRDGDEGTRALVLDWCGVAA